MSREDIDRDSGSLVRCDVVEKDADAVVDEGVEKRLADLGYL